MYLTMNNLAGNLVTHTYHYSIGDNNFWKSKSNADHIVCEYSSNIHIKPKDLDINTINCWFYLEDNNFKHYMINNVLHILKTNNYQFYDEIEY